MELKHKYKLGETVNYGNRIARISVIKATTARKKGVTSIMESCPIVYYLMGVNEWIQEQFLTKTNGNL